MGKREKREERERGERDEEWIWIRREERNDLLELE